MKVYGIIVFLSLFYYIHSTGNTQMNDKETLLIVPFDDVSTDVLRRIGESLTQQLNIAYDITAVMSIPPAAYNQQRRQYHSSILLEMLIATYGKTGKHILGIADYDLFVPQLNFVFGEADVYNKTAVISLTRLRQEYYHLPPDNNLFLQRALTEAIHELGHTYGLQHCSNPHCVMFFSNALADTDRKGYLFCDKCKTRLKQNNKEK